MNTKAVGKASTAMGTGTEANGPYSTAMNNETTASGEGSTAMGLGTEAIGQYSLAMGQGTISKAYSSLTTGVFNNANHEDGNDDAHDNSDFAFVIGNGTSSLRSDALTVRFSGQTNIHGSLTVDDDLTVIGNIIGDVSGHVTETSFNNLINNEIANLETSMNTLYDNFNTIYDINNKRLDVSYAEFHDVSINNDLYVSGNIIGHITEASFNNLINNDINNLETSMNTIYNNFNTIYDTNNKRLDVSYAEFHDLSVNNDLYVSGNIIGDVIGHVTETSFNNLIDNEINTLDTSVNILETSMDTIYNNFNSIYDVDDKRLDVSYAVFHNVSATDTTTNDLVVNNNLQVKKDSYFERHVTIDGSLNVIGGISTNHITNTTTSNAIIELGTGTTVSRDSGIIIERGDVSNVFMGWDEGEQRFIMVNTTSISTSTAINNKTIATLYANLNASNIVAGDANFSEEVNIGKTLSANGGSAVNVGTVALGQNTHANNNYAVAMGANTTASGLNSTAMGADSKASGDYSFAIGSKVHSSNNFSLATGEGTISCGLHSTAMGLNTNAIGIGLVPWETELVQNLMLH